MTEPRGMSEEGQEEPEEGASSLRSRAATWHTGGGPPGSGVGVRSPL